MLDQAATEGSAERRLSLVRAPGFVGRSRELAALTGALTGSPAVVLIEGEAGIGKSRLVREYLASPAGQARTAVLVTCPPFRQPQTLGPVAAAIRQAAPCGVRELGLSGLAGVLRPLFPEWSGDLPPAPEPAEDVSAVRHRVFAALAELLGRLGVSLLVVEDIHWADEASLEFLLGLAASEPRQLGLVVTCRPEDVPAGSLLPRLARMAAGSDGLRLALGPLDVAGTAGLVSSMLAGEHVSDSFVTLLHERSEGVPLAVEESLRLLADRGDLARHRGQWLRLPLEEIAVPPTVRDAVLERAGRLRPDAQAVLHAAAVLADPASETILTTVTGLPPGRARVGLCEVLGSGLLTEDSRGLVSFRHVLAARAVYEAIPLPRRRLLHLRAGTALENTSSPSVAWLARHFREAREVGKWVTYAEQAADIALASGDGATASTVLQDLVTAADLPAWQVAQLTSKIPFTSHTKRSGLQILARALRLLLDTGIPDQAEAAEVRYQLGRVLTVMEEPEAGRIELEQAIPHLDPARAAVAMMLLGIPRGNTWPASTHRRWLRRATEAASSLPPADRLRLAADRTAALLLLGDPVGWSAAAQIPMEAPAAEDRWQITRFNLNMSHLAMLWGRYPEAQRRLDATRELADRYQHQRFYLGALATQAHLDWYTGCWNGLTHRIAALADDDDALPLLCQEVRLVTALLDAAAGASSRAEQRASCILEELRRLGAVEALMEATAILARLQLANDRIPEAIRITDEPMSIVARKGIWLWATEVAPVRVWALAASGRVGEAADLVASFAGGLRGRRAPAPHAALMLSRAILAESSGELSRAVALFARAAAAWQALPRPYDALRAREHQANCLLAAGKVGTGLALLTEVQTGLSGLGAAADADRVAHCLRGHGVTVPRVWRGGRHGYGDRLSPREQEVVDLAASGRTTREIARELYRSPDTVYTQLRSAMRKLGVSSRAALAHYASGIGAAGVPGRTATDR